jgi:hypothetical protein
VPHFGQFGLGLGLGGVIAESSNFSAQVEANRIIEENFEDQMSHDEEEKK